MKRGTIQVTAEVKVLISGRGKFEVTFSAIQGWA